MASEEYGTDTGWLIGRAGSLAVIENVAVACASLVAANTLMIPVRPKAMRRGLSMFTPVLVWHAGGVWACAAGAAAHPAARAMRESRETHARRSHARGLPDPGLLRRQTASKLPFAGRGRGIFFLLDAGARRPVRGPHFPRFS